MDSQADDCVILVLQYSASLPSSVSAEPGRDSTGSGSSEPHRSRAADNCTAHPYCAAVLTQTPRTPTAATVQVHWSDPTVVRGPQGVQSLEATPEILPVAVEVECSKTKALLENRAAPREEHSCAPGGPTCLSGERLQLTSRMDRRRHSCCARLMMMLVLARRRCSRSKR